MKIVSMVLTKITGRKYTFKRGDLNYALSKGTLPLIRGLFFDLMQIKRPRGIFLGKNIQILGKQNLTIGNGCSIGSNSYIECFANQKVTFQNRVTVREYCWIQCRSGFNTPGELLFIDTNTYIGPFAVIGVGGPITIGKNCQIGARLALSAEQHLPSQANQSYVSGRVQRKGISIGNDVWIGNNVTILDGVSVGNNSVIGAGSVVTNSIPDNMIAYGVPARFKTRTKLAP